MRLLLVSHSPLLPELGAARIALELAAALCARGHEAIAWSPSPLPEGTPWWRTFVAQRRALEKFLAASERFDAIDAPPVTISPAVARAGFTIARSNQPALAYLALDLRAEMRRLDPRAVLHAGYAAAVALAHRAGLERADRILALGQIELQDLARRASLRPKLASYLHALAPTDRAALADVRQKRALRDPQLGVRFLWIGRWAEHKGPRVLLSWIGDRAKSHPCDTFTVAGCGAGAERALTTRAARALREAGRLRVVPHFSRAELPALLAAHDAGVFTSIVEGWGLSLNEMIESGMPVYATPAGGVADLAATLPRTMRPFPPPHGIDLATEPIDDLEKSGYFERFSWRTIAADYERVIDRPKLPH